MLLFQFIVHLRPAFRSTALALIVAKSELAPVLALLLPLFPLLPDLTEPVSIDGKVARCSDEATGEGEGERDPPFLFRAKSECFFLAELFVVTLPLEYGE